VHRSTGIGHSLEKALYWVTRQASNLAMIVLMAMVLMIVVDITLRRFFNSPLSWSFEVIEVMLVIVVFFTVAYCCATKGHISVDLLTSRLSKKGQVILEVLGYLLGLILFAFMTWCSILSALEEMASHRVTGILLIPIYPFILVVALGSTLLALVLLAQLINTVREAVRK
jgi:TRAP-type C4-dicarboxylate transport system permease small subunit